MPFARPSTRLLAALMGMGLMLGAPVALAGEAPRGLLETLSGDRSLTWDAAISDLARADVVFVGEPHGDPATHRLERAMLRDLHAAVGHRLVLSLEMFERDVQPVLDAYLQGRIPEEDFLSKSRPWPNYQTDYHPLVAYAKAHAIPVLAANVPRRLASQVAMRGLDSLNALSPDERQWAASEVDCPRDRLYARFIETMQGHPGLGEADVERMFLAQCLKDATMAESIALAFTRAKPLLLHLNGSFHSDEGLGVPAQLRTRAPGLVQRVTTVLPSGSEDAPPRKGLADVVFIVQREEKE